MIIKCEVFGLTIIKKKLRIWGMVDNYNCGHTMGWFIKTIVFLQNSNNSNRQPDLTQLRIMGFILNVYIKKSETNN